MLVSSSSSSRILDNSQKGSKWLEKERKNFRENSRNEYQVQLEARSCYRKEKTQKRAMDSTTLMSIQPKIDKQSVSLQRKESCGLLLISMTVNERETEQNKEESEPVRAK